MSLQCSVSRTTSGELVSSSTYVYVILFLKMYFSVCYLYGHLSKTLLFQLQELFLVQTEYFGCIHSGGHSVNQHDILLLRSCCSRSDTKVRVV